jgi:hypothetical protein
LTDEETVEQIRENAYMQFFLGFAGYSSKIPFDPSMMGLIHPAAGLEDRGQEAAGAQFGDLQREIPHLGGQSAGPVAVAVAEMLLAALVPVSTEEGGKLQLDQLLQAMASQFRDQLPGAAVID